MGNIVYITELTFVLTIYLLKSSRILKESSFVYLECKEVNISFYVRAPDSVVVRGREVLKLEERLFDFSFNLCRLCLSSGYRKTKALKR